MKCRSCATEIADKAIVCFRCGTPTAAPPPAANRPVPRRLSVWLIMPLLVLMAINIWLVPRVTDELWLRIAGWALAVAAVVVLARLARR